MKKIVLVFSIFLFSNLNYAKANEFIQFKYFDPKLKKEIQIAAQIYFPKKKQGKLPVIIAMHGSTRDTMKFKNGGKSNEFAKRIMKRGVREGYVVVVPDLFYKQKDVGKNKTQFPNGKVAIMKLRKMLMEDKRFDRNNFFFTGFSWGGETGLGFLNNSYKNVPRPYWKAIASAEPGCNRVPEPIKYDFPILIVKGEKSHYPPKPCIYYKDLINKKGNNASVEVISAANHFYSTDLKETKGVAINACSDNIAIKKIDGSWIRANGDPSTGKLKECWGSRVVSGKNYKKLNEAIDIIFKFFNKYKS